MEQFLLLLFIGRIHKQEEMKIGWMRQCGMIILGCLLFMAASPAFANTSTGANNRDSLALVAIYNAMNGPSWTNAWDFDEPIDDWYGVETNLQGDVVYLNLSRNGLTGSLPSDIGFLIELRELHLEFNGITGGLPLSIGILVNLEHLTVFNNRLDLPIPDTLANLGKLQMLSLSNNLIPGAIPSRIGSMTSLKMMLLDRNMLTGVIPQSIGGLTNLEVLGLNNNRIEGPIPSTIGDLKNLRECLIFENRINGALPTSMTEMDSLTFLWAYNNELDGSLPLFKGEKLRSIRVEGNQISELPLLDSLTLGTGFPDGLSVQNNQLSFDDLIINRGLSQKIRWSYRPQDTIKIQATAYANEGDRLQVIMPFDDTVATSSFRWFKNGNLNQLINDNVFVINNVQKSDEGMYYAEIRNDIIRDLILVTTELQVIVRDSASCDQPPSGRSCFVAPVFCQPEEGDLYCGSLPTALDTMSCSDIGLSGEARWIGWVADTSFLSLDVLPYSCSDVNAGVQWELYHRCSGRTRIACQSMCLSSISQVELTDLVKGDEYFLAIRSCGGTCKYQVRILTGGSSNELTLDGNITGADTLCSITEEATYMLDSVPGSVDEWIWTVNGDTSDSKGPTVSFTPGQSGFTELCVTGISPCDTTNTICKEITIFEGLDIEDFNIDVVRDDSFYVVSFKISRGQGTITIDGVSGKYNAVNKIFTSDVIRCGQSYTITISDESGCSFLLEGIEVCNCSSEAGTMPTDVAEACANEGLRAGPASGFNRDSNDVNLYYLLEGQSFNVNNIFASSRNGSFQLENGMQEGRVYYVFHIVGNDNNGTMDLSDPCLSESNPQPVIFYSLPEANAGMDQTYCEKTFILRARKSRSGTTGSWRVVGNQGGVVISSPTEATTNVNVVQTGMYTFEWTEETDQCSDRDSVQIEIFPEIEAQIIGPDSLCNGQTATLALDKVFDSYSWDTGDTTAAITINQPGQYCCTVVKDSLCSKRVCIVVQDAIVNAPQIMGDSRICIGEETQLQVIPQYDTYSWSTGDSTFFITVDTAGLYCITVTDFSGCQATDCLVVNVDKSREVTLMDTLCFGEAIEIFDSAYVTSGEYEIRMNDGAFCDSVVYLNLFVHPEIFISDTLIVRDDGSGNGSISVNIRGGLPPYKYLWNTGAEIPFINGLTEAVYTLTVTDQNNCTQLFSFDLRPPVSTQNLQEVYWQIYPNPVHGSEKLTLLANYGVMDTPLFYEWKDLKGQTISQGEVSLIRSDNSGFLPIPEIKDGVYLLYLSDLSGNRSQTLRIIKM